MPKKDQTGPPGNSTGPKDGRGGGEGRHVDEKGTGPMTGGKKGIKDPKKKLPPKKMVEE